MWLPVTPLLGHFRKVDHRANHLLRPPKNLVHYPNPGNPTPEERNSPTNPNSAILTKYTALRSYHEQTVRGSPLDYENAGIYTSGLLDAYAV